MNLLSVRDVSKLLNCSTTQVYRLLHEGFLSEYRNGRRHYIIAESVQEYISAHTHDGMIDASITYARLVRDICHREERTNYGTTKER